MLMRVLPVIVGTVVVVVLALEAMVTTKNPPTPCLVT
jgi:hypothetical protein